MRMSALIRHRAGYGPAPDDAGGPDVQQPTGEPAGDVQAPVVPDFDGGARTTAPGRVSMDVLIRRAAGVIR